MHLFYLFNFILKLVEDVLYEYPEIETYVQVNIVHFMSYFNLFKFNPECVF